MTQTDFSGLKAVFVNCSLKRSATESRTGLLMSASSQLMERHGVEVATLHMADHPIAFGIYPDMTEHGAPIDAWPELWPTVNEADILVVGTPISLGEESSLCRVLIERLYAMSGGLNDLSQSSYYNKVGGCVITGNEDGIKHCSMSILYALQHLGYTIPPQADCGWIGEAGPGPSYGDEAPDGSRIGFDNDFTQRNTTIMTWNLMHAAKALKANGYANEGNDRRAWAAGTRFDFENPEYRV